MCFYKSLFVILLVLGASSALAADATTDTGASRPCVYTDNPQVELGYESDVPGVAGANLEPEDAISSQMRSQEASGLEVPLAIPLEQAHGGRISSNRYATGVMRESELNIGTIKLNESGNGHSEPCP